MPRFFSLRLERFRNLIAISGVVKGGFCLRKKPLGVVLSGYGDCGTAPLCYLLIPLRIFLRFG
jgi:hypothetical protein